MCIQLQQVEHENSHVSQILKLHLIFHVYHLLTALALSMLMERDAVISLHHPTGLPRATAFPSSQPHRRAPQGTPLCASLLLSSGHASVPLFRNAV